MGYLSPFRHDIFISYARVDNLDESPWVERFHKQLEIALASRIGRMNLVKFWRDNRLEGGQLFDQSIKDAIDGSAIFLALMSNGYLSSEYCLQELDWFYEKAGKEPHGLTVGDRSRIINANLMNIPHQNWPAKIGRITGFPFHDAEEDGQLGQPTDPETNRASYREQLRRLADAIYNLLIAFKTELGQQEPAPAASKSNGEATAKRKVFLADVADTLASAKKRLIAELERNDVVVKTGVPPPYEAEPHEKKVLEFANDAQLSIHLFDQFPGREVAGEAAWYPQKQLQLLSSLDKPKIVWVPKELSLEAIEEQEHQSFLQALENGPREQSKYDFIRGAAPLLASQILEKLQSIDQASAPPPGKRAVLLDTHLKDQLYALELGRLLLESNIQPYINPQEDDPSKNMEILEARLKEVSTLMIIYGSVNEDWVRHRLGAAIQLSVINKLPLKSLFVFSAPPEKNKQALDFNLGPITIPLIDNSHSPTIDRIKIKPLLAATQAGGTA